MERIPANLTASTFDLLIIGGGITGACIAADAAMRGMSVALVEKSDFCAATSSASSKLLHGGLRYLQQGAPLKVRESAFERSYFTMLAPHLTRYVPFVVPTYRALMKSKLVMRIAMKVYELLCTGQNRHIADPDKKVPSGRTLNREQILRLIPGFKSEKTTGGILFYETHMHSSERMVLAFLDTAARHGAILANYTTARDFLVEGNRVCGIRAHDLITDTSLEVRASLVINAAGPWIPAINKILINSNVTGIVTGFSKGAHIVTKNLTDGVAVALNTQKRTQALITRGGRHVFIIPWRDHSLIGTTYNPYDGDLDQVAATDEDIEELIEDINYALGSQVLERSDVVYAFAGIYPLVEENINPLVYQGTGKYQVFDHAKKDDIEGLLSVFGAKFTTARLLAEKALDVAARKLERDFNMCQTRTMPLAAGDISNLALYIRQKQKQYSDLTSPDAVQHLVTRYGTGIDDLMAVIENDPEFATPLVPDHLVLLAEIVYAVKFEMAVYLSDVVFRRTGLGTLGNPGRRALFACADIMGNLLNWTDAKKASEVEATLHHFVTSKAFESPVKNAGYVS